MMVRHSRPLGPLDFLARSSQVLEQAFARKDNMVRTPELAGLDDGEAQQAAGPAALLRPDLVPHARHVRELAPRLDHVLCQHLLDAVLFCARRRTS